MAYLDDNPPARRQFYCPRRDDTQPSGVVVVHTAENTPDFVAFDGGAEAVARFIQGRDTPGSYHDLADSDSIIQLVRYECEAFHDATGTNRHSYGVSGATRADVWPLAPQEWRDGCVRNMALAARRYAAWLKARRGVVIPAKRISVASARNGTPGFISHAELDPTRRTDPGAGFPWTQFLTIFAEGDDDVPNTEAEIAAGCARALKGITRLIPGVGGGADADAVWAKYVYDAARESLGDLDLTPDAIAAAVVAALPPSSGGAGLTQADVEAAVRSVFADAATS
jgi:hypothetical protein